MAARDFTCNSSKTYTQYVLMHPSKNEHIVAQLRSELSLTQKEFAKRILVHHRTIQAIELGKRNLSRPIAEKISDTYDFNLPALLTNQTKGGFRRANGSPWTNKTRLTIEQKFKRWGELEPEARSARLASTQVLLGQYLQMRDFFERHRDPETDPDEVLRNWLRLYYLCYSTLFDLYGKERLSAKTLVTKRNYPSIIGDIQALQTNLRVWTREMKRQAKRENQSPETGLKRVYADLYGWNDRGLEAIELAREIGFEKAAKMPLPDFSRLLEQRLRKKGMRIPKGFDPFQAIAQYHKKEQALGRTKR